VGPEFATACHEAGHAVACWHLAIRLEYVTLDDHFTHLPSTQPLDHDYPTDRDAAESWAVQAYAGQAAEEQITGKPSSGSDHDRKSAREVMAPFIQDSTLLDSKLASLEHRARLLVRDLCQAVEGLATELLKVTEMTGDEVDHFLSGPPVS
jgi:hypothetical protein